MSVDERSELRGRESMADTVAGFLAAAALVTGIVALVWYPGRLGPAAMLVALVAAALGREQRRLAAWALAIATVCWFAGMTIAVVTENPIF